MMAWLRRLFPSTLSNLSTMDFDALEAHFLRCSTQDRSPRGGHGAHHEAVAAAQALVAVANEEKKRLSEESGRYLSGYRLMIAEREPSFLPAYAHLCRRMAESGDVNACLEFLTCGSADPGSLDAFAEHFWLTYHRPGTAASSGWVRLGEYVADVHMRCGQTHSARAIFQWTGQRERWALTFGDGSRELTEFIEQEADSCLAVLVKARDARRLGVPRHVAASVERLMDTIDRSSGDPTSPWVGQFFIADHLAQALQTREQQVEAYRRYLLTPAGPQAYLGIVMYDEAGYTHLKRVMSTLNGDIAVEAQKMIAQASNAYQEFLRYK